MLRRTTIYKMYTLYSLLVLSFYVFFEVTNFFGLFLVELIGFCFFRLKFSFLGENVPSQKLKQGWLTVSVSSRV